MTQIDASDKTASSVAPLELEDVDPNLLDAAAADARRTANRPWMRKTDELSFPELKPDGVLRRFTPGLPPPENSTSPAARTQRETVGLLDELSRQADVIRERQAVDTQHAARVALELGSVLYRVYVYLNNMTRQLNVIKPEIPRHYQVLDRYMLSDFVWQHGFVDYYSLPDSPEDTAASISFAYRMRAADPLEFERDASVSERLRHMLFDAGMKVEIQEFRLKDHYVVDRVRFVVEPEIRVSMNWQIDIPDRVIRVQALNLERLGTGDYLLPPERLTQEVLDALGYLVLGRCSNAQKWFD
jgi:hypothetical protein